MAHMHVATPSLGSCHLSAVPGVLSTTQEDIIAAQFDQNNNKHVLP